MATVAKMDNGEYIMSYEFCPPPCHIHVKTSKDGFNWNASDVSAVSTADGISAGREENEEVEALEDWGIDAF
jgi:hypothetical protein